MITLDVQALSQSNVADHLFEQQAVLVLSLAQFFP